MAGVRIKVKMNSSESSHSYTTTKNPRTVTEKLKLNKYDPFLRKTVEYVEGKIKS
ncbi:MAG: 50S ribosomal protein L33 [Legionellaceae bacterium]|nr:50S ribosomal protein L33 [Legionellaceae bacterium]